MVRILISIPELLKLKLDALRGQGTTASGLIRHLLLQHFSESVPSQRKRRLIKR
jgi:hypothetical protein